MQAHLLKRGCDDTAHQLDKGASQSSRTRAYVCVDFRYALVRTKVVQQSERGRPNEVSHELECKYRCSYTCTYGDLVILSVCHRIVAERGARPQ